MREFEIKPELDKKLVKLYKKDKKAYEAVMKKIREVINSYDVEHYKNLQYNMKGSKRIFTNDQKLQMQKMRQMLQKS